MLGSFKAQALSQRGRPVCVLECAAGVFGRVEEGSLQTVQEIAEVPRYDPAANIRGFNLLASALGDSRSKKAQASWGKPLKAVVITGCDSGFGGLSRRLVHLVANLVSAAISFPNSSESTYSPMSNLDSQFLT